jgi:prophage regulatory protein
MNNLLTLNEVGKAVQRGRTGIYALIKSEQAFPAPIKIGRSSRWLASEVNEWIAEQAAKPRPLAQAMVMLEGGAK